MRAILFLTLITIFAACGSKTDSSTATTAVADPIPAPSTQKGDLRPVAKTNPNAIPAVDPNAENPDIRIKVKGAQPGLVRIIGFFAGEQYRADSMMVDGAGGIHIKHDSPWRTGLYYVAYPGNVAFQMIVAADQTFTMETDANDPVNAMKIEGSKENELLYKTLKFEMANRDKFNQADAALKQSQPGTPQYEKFKAEKDRILAERKAFLNDLFENNKDSFFAKYKMAGQNPEVRDIRLPDGSPDKLSQVWHYRRDFWDNVDFNDLRLLNTPVITNKLKRYINELTPQVPDSITASAKYLVDKVLDYPEYYQYFANWITLNYDPLETTLMDPQAVFVFMIENYFTYDRAFWSDSTEVFALQQRAYEMSASLVGKKAPNVTVPGIDGSPKTLYDLKAPYLIVYMYNPDCEHCAVETPKLVEKYKTWKNQGVQVYAIAVDTDDAKWRAYVRDKGMQGFTNVFDPTNKSIYAKYFVDHTPELYLINPERIIIAKNLKVHQVEEMINRDKSKRQG